MKNNLRIATYSRVSTTNHDQKPEVQVQDLRRYCKARGWKVTYELVDRATGGNDNRPGLKRLMELARAREIDVIIVVKLDRLFRSLKHLIGTLEEFKALGIEFIATRDQVDFTTPAGRLFIQVLGSLAEFEKELLRERTILGLEHAKACGKKLGRPKTRDDEQIKTLRRQGLSYRAIQKRLKVSQGAIWRALQT